MNVLKDLSKVDVNEIWNKEKKARKLGLNLSSVGLEVEIIDAFGDFDKNDMAELTEKEVEKIKKFIKNTWHLF